MLMRPSQSGKSFMLNVDLKEYPFAREIKPSISILLWNTSPMGVSEVFYKNTVVVQTYITTTNTRFIHVIPRKNAVQEDIDKVFEYINDYIATLNAPRSCEVDPHTGHYPITADDEDWI